MGTKFSAVYNHLLNNKITDDMYLELTPEDTRRDLSNMLIGVLPGFEFPRKDLSKYTVAIRSVPEANVGDGDFVITTDPDSHLAMIDNSSFEEDLTLEEINILAILMMEAWVQRQVSSIENTRMKFTGSDFKMTSQANHLSKLLNLLGETQRQSIHMQRLYKRRRVDSESGRYRSNWDIFRNGVFDDE